jgi:acetyl-CoA C-acetyltransferase
MTEAYIFDAIRTPRGKGSAKRGSLKDIKPIHLLNQLYQALENRTNLNDSDISEVLLGCVGQVGDQGADIAKISTLYHGWGDHINGATVNTFCTSSLTAIGMATAKIRASMSDLIVAGGVEMLSRVPMYADKGSWFTDEEVIEKSHFTQMGVAADLIASIEHYEREELDAYAVQAHQRAVNATKSNFFKPSMIPVKDKDGMIVLEHDENIRPDTTLEGLQSLEPLFAQYITPSIRTKIKERYPQLKELKHFHHLGNSPSMADGACILLMGSLEKGKAMGLTPRAKVRSFDSTSCEPIIMLLGGQLSMENAVKKAGLTMQEIDLHNFAEAFSATCLKYQRDLSIDPNKFNVNGCTMVMGHAQGASGAMITTTLLDEMERRDVQFGVAGISGGAGLGAGIVIERV